MNSHYIKYIASLLVIFLSLQELQSQFAMCDNPEINMVMDINTAPATYQEEREAIAYGSQLLYVFDDGSGLPWIWRSDGTDVGTIKLSNDYKGEQLSDPDDFLIYKDYLYFTATTIKFGNELWRINLASASYPIELIGDIHTGSESSSPADLLMFKELLCFTADNGDHGREMWVYNPLLDKLVEYETKLDGPGLPENFTSSKHVLYFSSRGTYQGSDLYGFDGGSVFLIKDLNPGLGSSPSRFIIYKDLLYFGAIDSSGISRELWRSNGTAVGTTLVKDINPGSSASSPIPFVVSDGVMLFSAEDSAGDRELWKTDGTEAGTEKIKDLWATGSSLPREFIVYKDQAYFEARGDGGYKLWKTDGTTSGTILMEPIIGDGGIRRKDFLITSSGLIISTSQDELWITEGGASPLNSIPITTGDSFRSIEELTLFNNRVFFTATDIAPKKSNKGSIDFKSNEYGRELLMVDLGNSTLEAEVFLDLNPGLPDGQPSILTVANDFLFFFGQKEIEGVELHVLDTGFEYKDLGDKSTYGRHTQGTSFRSMAAIEDILYFVLIDSIKVYRSIGDASNTAEIDLGLPDDLSRIFQFKGQLYIIADVGDDRVLYRSDGTLLGISEVGILPDESVNWIINTNEYLYLYYGDGTLWVTDGIGAPVNLNENQTISGATSFTQCATVENNLLLTYNNGSDVRLWKANGPSEPLEILLDVSVERDLISWVNQLESKAIFNVLSLEGQNTLWTSDGTPEGTVPLDTSIVESGERVSLLVSNGHWGIVVTHDNNNFKIWKTDGTKEGTSLLMTTSATVSNISQNGIYFDILLGSAEDKTIVRTDGTPEGTMNIGLQKFPILLGVHSALGQVFYELSLTDLSNISSYIINDEGQLRLINRPLVNVGSTTNGDQAYVTYDDGVHGRELWKIDCSCMNNLSAQSYQMAGGIYQAENTMQLEGSVLGHHTTYFQAGDNIDIEAGFVIPASSEVSMDINNCRSN